MPSRPRLGTRHCTAAHALIIVPAFGPFWTRKVVHLVEGLECGAAISIVAASVRYLNGAISLSPRLDTGGRHSWPSTG